MRVKPVTKRQEPGYPDKYGMESLQALMRSRPKRWAGKPVAGGVLAATIALGLSGCGYVTEGAPVAVPTPTAGGTCPIPQPPRDTEHIVLGEPMPTHASFGNIPLFAHGEGTGTIGCVSVSAPVFLSEEEAVAIISAEFDKAGYMLEKNGSEISAALPVTKYNSDLEKPLDFRMGKLSVDGALPDFGLSVEFVSSEDYTLWHENEQPMLSVETYRMKDAAQLLTDSNQNLLVLYDPATYVETDALSAIERTEGMSDEAYQELWNEAHEAAAQEARAVSERQLREQVTSFLSWLKAEGVL